MAELISKKRKRSSSFSPHHPFAGIFTRSKSQIYLHCTRSGRSRSDSVRRHKHQADLRSASAGSQSGNTKRTQKTETTEIKDDWSRVFIQDLRARRVFSLGSIPNDCELSADEEAKTAPEKRTGRIQDPNLSSDSINLESINSGSFVDKEGVDINARSCSESKEVEEKKVTLITDVEFPKNCCGNDDIPIEVCVQATPPDTEILQKLSIENDAKKSGPKYCETRKLNLAAIDASTASPTKGICLKIESQPIPADECKVDGNSMEAQAADSVPHDVDTSVNGSLDDTDSNITYTQCNANSLKDSCTTVSSPTSRDNDFCLKQSIDDANEKIKVGVSCKDKNLESSSSHCTLKVLHNPTLNGNLNESEPPAGDKSRVVVGNSGCSSQDMNLETFDIRHCKTVDQNHAASYMSSTEGSNEKNKGDNDCAVDKIDDSNEESLQMTKPGVGNLGEPVIHENVDKGTEFVSQNNEQVLGKPLIGSFHNNKSYFSNKSVDSNSKRKMGLSPCSQLKLFKAGSSFSYRRLLPYLMDIAKDNSGDFANGDCPKLGNGVEGNLSSPLSMPHLDETPAIKLEQNTNSCNGQMLKCDMSHLSSSNQCNLEPFEGKTRIPPLVVMTQEPEMQVMKLISDNGQPSVAPHVVNIADASSPDTLTLCSSLVIPNYCDADILDVGLHESAVTSGTKLGNAAKPAEGDSLSQNSTKLEASCILKTPATTKKGILKRTPRGCRGPCTCLNCASFRLHAERAFEFSKNQMQDAEEVALHLINELSHFRNMLNKASSGCNDNLVICINQVKEACRKASEAEELAKSHLNQMNYDLEVHCRVTEGQRPRVKFANDVEERTIS